MVDSTISRSGRIPGLDGLRGVAAMIVLLSHASNRHMYLAPNLDFSGIGKSGVYLFFVLSAMLLASQMLTWGLKEYQMSSKWYFYFKRRIFRIWPLFLFVLLVSLLTTLYGPASLAGHGLPVRIEPEMLISALVLQKEPSLLWTIAVEFKFYFILPIICFINYMLFRNQMVPSLILIGILVTLSYNYFPPAAHGESPGPFLTTFLFGIASAVIYNAYKTLPNVRSGWMEALSWLMVILFICTIPSVYSSITGKVVHLSFLHTKHILFSSIWSIMILSMLYGKGWLCKILESRPLVFLGKISYSLYVWHLAVVLPVFWFISAHSLVKGWVAVSGAILLASISFYLIERPVLRWSAKNNRRR